MRFWVEDTPPGKKHTQFREFVQDGSVSQGTVPKHILWQMAKIEAPRYVVVHNLVQY